MGNNSLREDLTALGFVPDRCGWAWVATLPNGAELVVEVGASGWLRCYETEPVEMLYEGEDRIELILTLEDALRYQPKDKAAQYGY